MALHLNWLGTYVQASHDDHEEVVGRGEIDIVHDQQLTITEARIGADVGLPGGFGATLVLPVRLVSTSIRYLDSDAAEVELATPGIHHRNETLTGLGDPMVMGSYGRSFGPWRLSARAGASLPLGRTEEDPFALGDMEVRHQHIQMGTGTVNPIVAVEGARTWRDWRFGAFLFTQQALYANGKGYQAGDRYAGGLGARRRMTKTLNLRLGSEFLSETAERWNGEVQTSDGNRGRFDWMLSVGGSWSVAPGWSLDLGVKVPVVTRVVGGQLDMPALLEVGATWSFGGASPPPQDHDHDDHDGHDHAHPVTTGLDVLDVPASDASVELVPVPGKVTIFDFWATWCEPCSAIEAALVDLARANPEKIAIRRLDASNWSDYPFTMPRVVVIDAGGTRVFDRSSGADVDVFLAAIRAAVDPPQTTARIVVTERGFEPGNVTVPAGVPVTLTFQRQTDSTCATEVVMTVEGKRLEKPLPLGEDVALTITFPTPGTITYACGMDMIRGAITVTAATGDSP